MKKFFITLAFVSKIFSCNAIWDNGPTQLLKDIFKITDVQGVESLETAVKQSNFRWIRPKGAERWNVYSLLDNAQRKALSKKVKNSSLAKAKMPLKKHYDAIIVLGATVSRVKSRMEFLARIHKDGITCDKIYLLGSTRDLKIGTELDKEMAKKLESKEIEATEMAMMKEFWQQNAELKLIEHIPVIAIQSGQREDGTRANTEDTLRDMVKDFGDAKDKNFLFISDNPYICYQDAVAKKVLIPYGVSVETVGAKMSSEETMENVLDTVARCLTNIQGLNGSSKANQ